MRKNSLGLKGITISEAQSFSNAINQLANDINSQLSIINACGKRIKVQNTEYVLVKDNPLPEDIVDILKLKASLHATQAFLMENLKAKEKLLESAYSKKADISDIDLPEVPFKEYPKLIFEVKEEWGWGQLTNSELEEYYEAEAYAAHIGKFIHKDSILESLRKTTPNLPSIEWKEIEVGKQTPVTIVPCHNSAKLSNLHLELSKLHKTYENKTNYFKAKVKNLVTLENGRIAKLNNDEINRVESINQSANDAYQEEIRAYRAKIDQINSSFEIERENMIKQIVELRIVVPTRFQHVIDKVNNK